MYALFFILLFISLIAQPVTAAKSSGIKMSIETGIDSKIMSGQGFPLSITVENSGEDFSGDLLINFYPSYNSSGSKAVRIELPKGDKKTYSVSIPGYSEDQPYNNQNFQSIHLYEGDWQDDEEVDYKGPKNLKPKFIDMMKNTVAVLSEDPDRLKELKALSVGNQFEVLTMTETDVPENAAGLDMLDYIVMDEFSVSTLSNKQQEAIKEWIVRGGTLIAGAAPDASQSYGILYEVLPMEMKSEGVLNSAYFKTNPEVKTDFENVPVFTGPLVKNAKVVGKLNALPVVVQKEFGSGQILQTAFSLGDEPISAWKGYGDWFQATLLDNNPKKMNQFNGSPNPFENLYYEFAESNEYFKSVQFSLGQLALFLIIYLLILVPILYFVLKKWDKREHAWWVIPVIAFFSSTLIFSVGARDRLASAKINQMGVFRAEGGQLEGIQAVSLLSNTGGNYQMSFSDGAFNGVPGSMQPSMEAQHYAVLEEDRNGQMVTFPGVEYWSTRTQFGPAAKTDAGEFVSDLKFENKKLTGSIKNEFPYDFEEIYIWSGSKKVKLGSLKKGETIKVDKALGMDYLTSPDGYLNHNYYGSPQQDLMKMKKERLENRVSELLANNQHSENIPVIYGYTKDSVLKINLKERKKSENNVFLIFQPVTVKENLKGPFILKNDVLKMQLEVLTGGIMEEMNLAKNEAMIDDGEYEWIAHVPALFMNDKVKLSEVAISIKGKYITYSLFDYSTSTYTPLDETKKSYQFTGEDLGKYVSKEGEIKIKLLKAAKGDPHVYLPAITVKGEVKP